MNAGGRGASDTGIDMITDLAYHINTSWKIIFVSECDYHMTYDMYPNSSEGHFVLRHYGGPGTRAMCWIVHRDIIGLLGTVKWRNRAGALVFAQNPKDKGALIFCCIGTHGCHDGDTSGSLGEDRCSSPPPLTNASPAHKF